MRNLKRAGMWMVLVVLLIIQIDAVSAAYWAVNGQSTTCSATCNGIPHPCTATVASPTGCYNALWDIAGSCDYDCDTNFLFCWMDNYCTCYPPAQDCDDGDLCTIDACNAATGCSHTPLSCPVGQVCYQGSCCAVDYKNNCDSTGGCGATRTTTPYNSCDLASDVSCGAETICGDGIDQDCNGFDLSCGCTEGDSDNYYTTIQCSDYHFISLPISRDIKVTPTSIVDGENSISIATTTSRAALEFDLSSIPENAIIDGVRLIPSFSANPTSSLNVTEIEMELSGESFSDSIYISELFDDIGEGEYRTLTSGYNNISLNDSLAEGFPAGNNLSIGLVAKATANLNALEGGAPAKLEIYYHMRELDCNDANATINPGAVDLCGDGIDSNCDGEDFPGLGDTCTDGFGECANEGNYQCLDASNIKCSAVPLTPAEFDKCGDTKDNNCNGMADEGCTPFNCMVSGTSQVSASADNSVWPAMIWNGSAYIVSWRDSAGGDFINTAILASSGSKLLGPVTSAGIRKFGGDSTKYQFYGPSIAQRGNSYGILYPDKSSDGANQIRVALTDGAGVQQYYKVFNGGRGSIAWGGSYYGIVYHASGNVYFRKMTSSGVFKKTSGAIGYKISNKAAYPSIIWNSKNNEYAVVYVSTNDKEVYLQRLNKTGLKTGSKVKVSDGVTTYSFKPFVVWNGNEYAVFWADKRSGTEQVYMNKVALDSGGNWVRQFADDKLLSPSGSAATYPTASWDGSGYEVTWMGLAGSEWRVNAVKVDAAGDVALYLGTPVLPLTELTSGVSSRWPYSAWNGSSLGIAYHKLDSPIEVYFTRVDCSPECLDADGDGRTNALCGGTDCNDAEPLAYTGAPENCADNVDNDCDTLTDSADPDCCACTGTSCKLPYDGQRCDGCNYVAAPAEVCTGGADEDCDGNVDCADSDCASDAACCILKTFYRDSDNDGYGDPSETIQACACMP